MTPKESVHILTDRVDRLACHKCRTKIDVSRHEPFTTIECPECHVQTPIPAALGPFLLFKELGKGAMGAVYQAFDSTLKRHVAIKVMHRSLGQDAKFVNQFLGEARALAALNQQNVVQIYSCGQEKGQPYIVMELVPGGRVDKLMAKDGPLDEELALKVGIDVALGLKAAQEIGLTHGDIKPENILFGKSGAAKVVDFGLANLARGESKPGEIWGTPYYIAPEKARGKEGNHQADIYSLGATLFHALTGHPPFEAATPLDVVMARLKSPAPDVRTLRPDLGPATAAAIARMLEMEPVRRYPNYDSILSDLRKALEATQQKQAAPAPVRKKGPPVAVYTVIGLVAVGIAAAWFMSGKKKKAPARPPTRVAAEQPSAPISPAAGPARPEPPSVATRPAPPASPTSPRSEPMELSLPLKPGDADFVVSTAEGKGADAYVQGASRTKDNASATFADKKELWVKSEAPDALHLARKIFLRFDFSGIERGVIREATLRLTFDKSGKNTATEAYRLKLWGIKPNRSVPAWTEKKGTSALTWNNAPGNDKESADGLTSEAVLLAEVSVPANPAAGDALYITNGDSAARNALIDFINGSGPEIQFALTADAGSIPKAGWKFVAREQEARNAPTLLLKK
jgi:serine/threonine protein kinase